ncbi:MAG: Crp/Fnr family transcriptional regulator [Chitinophagales bacterium]|nr:Crp/Fnr family transcriptional regulator [Chitinophagales bacterium]
MQALGFINTFKQFENVPEDVEQVVASKIHTNKYPKRTMLLNPGEVCDKLYFIIKGLARMYYVKDSKEYTTDIVIDNEFLVEFLSFVSQRPSIQYIELLEDSTIQHIEYDDLQELYKTFPIMERIGRLIAEYHYNSVSNHSYQLKFNSTIERYQYLFDKKIEIIRRAPLGVIASFLGMSIENLSRIRRKSE